MVKVLRSVVGESGARGVFSEFNCLADAQAPAAHKREYAVSGHRFWVCLCIGKRDFRWGGFRFEGLAFPVPCGRVHKCSVTGMSLMARKQDPQGAYKTFHRLGRGLSDLCAHQVKLSCDA